MPYANTSELPANVQKLPAKAQRQWMHVFNSCTADGKPESKCFAMANGVAKRAKSMEGELTPDELSEVSSEKYYQYVESWDYQDRAISQDAAGYNPLGATADKGCANCNWFVAPGRCAVVAGTISPTGLSSLWRAVEEYAPDPIPVTIVGGQAAASDGALADRSSWRDRVMAAVKSALGVDVAQGQSASPAPVHSGRPPMVLARQKDGRLRFFTLWSNNFEDREKEIFTAAAHKEFVEWADATGRYPELWLWHTPGSKVGQVDWLDTTDGFVGASGLIDSDKEFIAEKLVEGGKQVGASHGYVGLQAGNTVHMYRSHEISALPLAYAAVPTTSFNLMSKEFDMGFTPQKRDWLKSTGIDDAQIAALEQQAMAASKALKDSGLAFKAEDLGLEAAVEAAPATTPAAAAVETKAAAPAIDPSVQQFMRESQATFGALAAALGEVSKTVKAIDERTKSIVKSDDQRVAEALTPQVVVAAGTPASQSAANVIDATKEAGPDMSWFGTNILGPLGVQTVTP